MLPVSIISEIDDVCVFRECMRRDCPVTLRDFQTALRPELFFSRPVVSVHGFLPLPDWRRWGVLCGGRGFAVRTDDDDDDITVSRDEKNDSGCSGSCAPLPLNAKLLNRSLACLRP